MGRRKGPSDQTSVSERTSAAIDAGVCVVEITVEAAVPHMITLPFAVSELSHAAHAMIVELPPVQAANVKASLLLIELGVPATAEFNTDAGTSLRRYPV